MSADVAAVLAKHRYVYGQQIGRLCACGEPDPFGQRQGNGSAAHRTHVAKVLQPVIAAAQAEALREAAEADAITIPDVLGYNVRAVAVEDLLNRADRIGHDA